MLRVRVILRSTWELWGVPLEVLQTLGTCTVLHGYHLPQQDAGYIYIVDARVFKYGALYSGHMFTKCRKCNIKEPQKLGWGNMWYMVRGAGEASKRFL